MKNYLFGLLSFFGTFQIAMAFPTLNPSQMQKSFPDTFTAAYNFEGIVALNNCSGSIVKFDDSIPTDKAMVLTNGHCVSMIPAGTVIVNQNSNRNFTVFDRSAKKIGNVSASKLLYATMTKTDMALYQLKETYEQITQQFKFDALTLARDYATPATKIEVISGYWKRGYSCSVDQIIYSLKEGNWTFSDSIRYTNPGCEVIGGTSGSPIIEEGTRTVIGVNNTGNESGGRCTTNNPCEVDENGVVYYQKGLSYGQQTSWVYTCRDANNKIDLNQNGCLLPK